MDKFCIQESSKVYSSCWKFLLCVVVITVSVEVEVGKRFDHNLIAIIVSHSQPSQASVRS